MTVTIAIDGPAGSGKSSVSKQVARASATATSTPAPPTEPSHGTCWRGAPASDTADEAVVVAAASDFPYAISLDPDDYWVRVGRPTSPTRSASRG
jgi:cytidylate kinase